MSHAVETMFYVKETPWHGLGKKLDSAPTISQAIVDAGLDWNVSLRELFTGDGVKVSHRATCRDTDGSILGVVGPRYVPLQNNAAFDWFQPFVDSGECSLHTAGSLHEGQKVWVLAQLNRTNSEIVPGDEISKFLLLSNSHDGSTAIRVGFTPIRVVCANTMAMAHQCDQSKLIRIRHTKSSRQNLDKVREVMDTINASFEATAEQFKFLASRNFNQDDVSKYVKMVLNVENATELPTKTQNIISSIMECIEGPMQSAPNVAGTWWAAYNGVNEYLNYKKGRTQENRMNNLWFGTGLAENRKALDLALTLAA